MNEHVHGVEAKQDVGARASRFLIGRETYLATHGGMPAISPAASPGRRGRHADELGEAGAERAQRRAADLEADSVTLRSPRRSSAIARSMRRVIRYEYGDSP